MAHIVTLSSGHGGKDCGALGQKGLHEADVNLAIALKTRDWLNEFSASSFNIKLLRTNNIYIPVDDRAKWAHSVGSELHTEFHCNAFNKKADYMGVWASIKRPGDAIHASHMADDIAKILNIPSKGVETRRNLGGFGFYDYYGVIRQCVGYGIPHVFFPECGFIDVLDTEARLRNPAIIDAIGKSIATRICDVFGISTVTQPKQTPVSMMYVKANEGTWTRFEAPNNTSKKLGKINPGEKYEVYDAGNGWCHIKAGKDYLGYVDWHAFK